MTPEETKTEFELKFRFVLGLICATLFIGFVFWKTYKADERDREYQTIHRDNKLLGTIISVEREWSWVRITMNDNSKWTIRSPEELVVFIKRDDILRKEKESDTIIVTRDGLILKYCISDK